MIISEKELIKIPIKENNEELVDVTKFDDRIKIVAPEYMKNTSLKRILIRKSIVEKLKSIQNKLPKNMNLVLTSGLRPLNIQKEIFDFFFEKIKKDNLKWTESQVRKETRKIVAPPDSIPPHSTGGAIDLTIYKNNEPLDMGCEIPMAIDANNPDINKFPTNAKNITKEQKKIEIF